MILSEVIEEITEKAPTYLSVPSIIRKITQVRDRILRNATSAQQESTTVAVGTDVIAGQSHYVLPCPHSSVTDIDILESAWGHAAEWKRLPYRQFNERSIKPYYYFLEGRIGIVPEPTHNVVMGIKVFHIPLVTQLTVDDMDKLTGIDPNYDMLLVYGVLRDITTGRESDEYRIKYEELFSEYMSVNSGWEKHVVEERW